MAMIIQVKCAFCDQPFDFDRAQERLLADCPHCKKQNTIFISTTPSKDIRIQRDAPNLSGSKICPSCKSTIGRDAVLCIRCGHDFKTGKKIVKPSWFSQHKGIVLASSAGFLVVIVALTFIFWPKSLPPPIAPITPPLAAQPPPTTPPPPAAPAPTPPVAQAVVHRPPRQRPPRRLPPLQHNERPSKRRPIVPSLRPRNAKPNKSSGNSSTPGNPCKKSAASLSCAARMASSTRARFRDLLARAPIALPSS